MIAIATLWARKIIEGNRSYSEVPKGLKTIVAEVLKSKGHEDLVTE